MRVEDIRPGQTLWHFNTSRYPAVPELRQVEVMMVPPTTAAIDPKECIITTTGDIIPANDVYANPQEIEAAIRFRFETYERIHEYYVKSLAAMRDQLTAVTFPA